MTPSAAPSNRLRTAVLLLLSCLFLLLALAAAVYWRLERRVWTLGEELVPQARALESSSGQRPRLPHVDTPTPGTFAQALVPLLPELRAFYAVDTKRDTAGRDVAQAVRQGKRPLSELPQEYRDSLEQHRELMRRTLLASHTAEAGLPEGFQLFAVLNNPDANGLVALQGMVRLAALDMRFRLEAGQADAALETCVDGLALARDMGHGSGLIGAMFSLAGTGILFPPCASALQRASPEGVRTAMEPLRRVRLGLSPFSVAMHEEAVLAPLTILGRVLDPQQVAALSPLARQSVGQSSQPSEGIPLVDPLLGRHALVEITRFDQRHVPLVDLPIALRTQRLQALVREMETSWNPLVRLMPGYGKFAARVDKQRAQMDLLLALAQVRVHHAEHGAWPTALPSVPTEPPMLLPTELRLEPGEAGTLRILPADTTLQELETLLGTEGLDKPALQVLVTP